MTTRLAVPGNATSANLGEWLSDKLHEGYTHAELALALYNRGVADTLQHISSVRDVPSMHRAAAETTEHEELHKVRSELEKINKRSGLDLEIGSHNAYSFKVTSAYVTIRSTITFDCWPDRILEIEEHINKLRLRTALSPLPRKCSEV